jgi:hypothetical protein
MISLQARGRRCRVRLPVEEVSYTRCWRQTADGSRAGIGDHGLEVVAFSGDANAACLHCTSLAYMIR